MTHNLPAPGSSEPAAAAPSAHEAPPATGDGTGTELVLRPGPWAHGGHTVARTDEGRVVFVRHADSGETVRVRLTESGPDATFWRADTVEVLEPSPHRRAAHPWEAADAVLTAAHGTAPVGGAELGHLGLPRQREVKTGVLRELLAGIGRFTPEEIDSLDPVVRPLPDEDPKGLGWRTRAHFDVDDAGHPAMHPHRCEDLVPVRDFPLMVPVLRELKLSAVDLTGVRRVDLAAPEGGQGAPLILLTPQAPGDTGTAKRLERDFAAHLAKLSGPAAQASVVLGPAEGERRPPQVLKGAGQITEHAAGHTWTVSAGGFWQIHRHAPACLLAAVTEAARVREGDLALDLYSGAGLFTAALAEAVGRGGRVLAVEGSPVASADARRTFAGAGQVEVERGGVEEVLARRWPGTVRAPRGGGRDNRVRNQRGRNQQGRHRRRERGGDAELPRPDVVVLDPPRAGAGKTVVDAVHALAPRQVVYVSCDPATLARDLARFRHHGWTVEGIEGLDLYPNTHHLETVVSLRL